MSDVYWIGGDPEKCETCSVPITDKFYDAKTNINGAWACMCPSCHTFGPGYGRLGLGLGQEFTKQPDGRFKKTAG